MSKSAFKVENFLAQIREGSLARTNRFEVIISAPTIFENVYLTFNNKVSLLCEVSNFPPINLSVKPFKIFGPSYQRPITSEYGGDGISMTFHVDRDMLTKLFFDEWIQSVVNKDNFTVNYQREYVTNIDIRQLDEQENVTYEIQLIDAFPRSMTLMDLNHSSTNQTHRLNVIFAYRYWKRLFPISETVVVPNRTGGLEDKIKQELRVTNFNKPTTRSVQEIFGASGLRSQFTTKPF